MMAGKAATTFARSEIREEPDSVESGKANRHDLDGRPRPAF